MGNSPSQPSYSNGFMHEGRMTQISNQVPPTLPMEEIIQPPILENVNFDKQCLVDTITSLAQNTDSTCLDKAAVNSALEQCALVNYLPISEQVIGMNESLKEQFVGVNQSSDGSSICISYTALFWLIIIIIIIVLLIKYNKYH